MRKVLGRGAYGVVASALDTWTGGLVAIKKIAHAFANATDARRTLREVKLLRHLRHENVVNLLDVLRPAGGLAAFSEVYLVYELMDTDLHQIIRSPQPLTEEHCAYFMFQARELGAAGCARLTRRAPRPRDADAARPLVHPLCARDAPRPEAQQLAAPRKL